MSDLTILFITASNLPENWTKFHQEMLLKVIMDYPIITISRKPLDLGVNLIQEGEISASNVYYQMLRGAKLATTPYVVIVEADTLYPKEHFEFRPPLDVFAYNMNRLGLFTWGEPTYFWKNRVKNSTLIAPRELMIKALEERYSKYPNGTPVSGELGRENVENKLGVTVNKKMEFFTETSVICIDHDFGLDHSARRHTKKMGPIKALSIPVWGEASKLIQHFK